VEAERAQRREDRKVVTFKQAAFADKVPGRVSVRAMEPGSPWSRDQEDHVHDFEIELKSFETAILRSVRRLPTISKPSNSTSLDRDPVQIRPGEDGLEKDTVLLPTCKST